MGVLYFRSDQKLIPINAHYTQTVLHHYIAKARPEDALHRTSKGIFIPVGALGKGLVNWGPGAGQ